MFLPTVENNIAQHWFEAWLAETVRKRRFREWLIEQTGEDWDHLFRLHEAAVNASEMSRMEMPEGI